MKLSTNQIEKNLNNYFDNPDRQIVFWFDDVGDFVDEVDELNLNAKILHLEKNNTFKVKYILEYEDPKTNYLVYAPFARPSLEDYYLADTIEYSIIFYADRNALLASKYGLDDKLTKVLADHSKFFNNKERVRKFDRIASSSFNTDKDLLIAIMSVLAKLDYSSFFDIINTAFKDELDGDLDLMDKFKSFGVYDDFWRMVDSEFSYSKAEPSIPDLGIHMYLTYLDYHLPQGIDRSYENFVLAESNNVIVYLNSLKNNRETKDIFKRFGYIVYNYRDINTYLYNLNVHEIYNIDLFRIFDETVIDWIISRIRENNLDVTVADMNIEELCDYRRSKYFGDEFEEDYQSIKNAYRLLNIPTYNPKYNMFEEIARFYKDEGYEIDTAYRKFYYYLDKKSIRHIDNEFKYLVEDAYTQKFLNPLSKDFSERYAEILNASGETHELKHQKDFYTNYHNYFEGRTVVIISDALRYEVGRELVKSLNRDNKFTNATVDMQLSEYPSITPVGMASLLPHRDLYMTDDMSKAVVDGIIINNNADRARVLKSYSNTYGATDYNKVMESNQSELREFFKNLELVYIYHDSIDATGDAAKTESGVLRACEYAISQIKSMIIKITNNVSITNYIVTSDHGFIYTRNKKQETDKIDLNEKNGFLNKRYYIGDTKYLQPGINKVYSSIPIDGEKRVTLTPKDSHIFKTRGRGQNYYHGGLSPQEIITPVITLNTQRYKTDKQPAKLQVITNSDTFYKKEFNLSFLQEKPLDPSVTPTEYLIQFVDSNQNPISEKIIHRADNKSDNAEDRIFNLNFTLLNRPYDSREDYFLIISDLNDDENYTKIKYIFDIQ